LAASIFHFGTFTIRQVKEHLRQRGIPVRLEGGTSPAERAASAS